jgi:hypothetical protein
MVGKSRGTLIDVRPVLLADAVACAARVTSPIVSATIASTAHPAVFC